MEITADQKALLQAIDPQVEDTFLNGVTQSGPYLPGLPQYNTIEAGMRQISRQGILSTFASLIRGLSLFRPTEVSITDFRNGFGPWPNSADFGVPRYTIGLDGRVHLHGLVLTPTIATSYNVILALPMGPSKDLIFGSVKSEDHCTIYVRRDGTLLLTQTTTSGEWVSLEGLSFYPA